MKTPTIRLDGRDFHGVTQALSAEQDSFIVGQLRLSGALPSLLAIKNNPTEEEAARLVTQIMVSGRMYQILGGLLTEEGKVWSYESAVQNGARFALITADEEKVAMQSAVFQFVAGFFLYAVQSSGTSPKSSGRSSKAERGASEARRT